MFKLFQSFYRNAMLISGAHFAFILLCMPVILIFIPILMLVYFYFSFVKTITLKMVILNNREIKTQTIFYISMFIYFLCGMSIYPIFTLSNRILSVIILITTIAFLLILENFFKKIVGYAFEVFTSNGVKLKFVVNENNLLSDYTMLEEEK